MNISYVKMTEEHTEALARLDKICFTVPWSKALFDGELKNPNAHYLVATSIGEPVGYCGIHTVLDEGDITNIAVLPDYRKSGIASALLEGIIEYALSENISFITLEVRESNINAIKLYEKFGFELVGERKNYYPDNRETALLMTKHLVRR